MRILAINWQDRMHPLAGGAEVHLHEILARLATRGHVITLLCSRFPGSAPREEYDNLLVARHGGRDTFNWSMPGQVRRLLRETAFDVVIDDINKIPLATPTYVRLPILAVVHHLFGRAIFREVNPLSASYVFLMESRMPRLYRRTPVMAVSESTKDDLARRGLEPQTIAVVHNGIDPSIYRADPGLPKGETPVIAYVGRLKKYKSIDHLLAAVRTLRDRFPALRLYIVGAGDDEPRLRRLAAQLAVADRVTFTGFAAAEEKVGVMRRAWTVVCPSLKEGWGLTNIEANACGTPAICADVPGLRDSVQDGVTGLLYPYGDVGALVERLQHVLTDRTLRDRLSKGAMAWAGQFSWDKAAERTEAILEHVAGGDRVIAGLGDPVPTAEAMGARQHAS